MLKFEILEVKYGWFDVLFGNEIKTVALTNSNYMGNDAPIILLRNLVELCDMENSTRYLCWHDEPGAYIIKLTKYKSKLEYLIYVTTKDSFELPYEGIDLEDEEVYEVMLSGETDFTGFISNIVEGYSMYSKGNNLKAYKENWGEFPMEEFLKLQKILF